MMKELAPFLLLGISFLFQVVMALALFIMHNRTKDVDSKVSTTAFHALRDNLEEHKREFIEYKKEHRVESQLLLSQYNQFLSAKHEVELDLMELTTKVNLSMNVTEVLKEVKEFLKTVTISSKKRGNE